MAILFLDVDGVLNHEETFRSRREDMIAPECAERLFRLLKSTGAKVVLSSSWRGMDHLEARLERAGVMAHVIGRTPHKNTNEMTRGHEIAEWLRKHPAELGENGRFAIVDDDSDMLPEHKPVFVQTDFRKGGLLDKHCDRLAAILIA